MNEAETRIEKISPEISVGNWESEFKNYFKEV